MGGGGRASGCRCLGQRKGEGEPAAAQSCSNTQRSGEEGSRSRAGHRHPPPSQGDPSTGHSTREGHHPASLCLCHHVSSPARVLVTVWGRPWFGLWPPRLCPSWQVQFPPMADLAFYQLSTHTRALRWGPCTVLPGCLAARSPAARSPAAHSPAAQSVPPPEQSPSGLTFAQST